MFERFTDRSRRAVVLAEEEARMLNHNYIGTEHILLGLIRERKGVAAGALESLGISLEVVRQQVGEVVGRGQQAPSGHIPFTPRAKKVLELALRESLQLGHNYIGTEHILLGFVREGDNVGCQILVKLGIGLDVVRQRVIQLLHDGLGRETALVAPAVSTSTSLVLDQFGRNLTAEARAGKLDPVIGREQEIARVMQVLSRRLVSNPMLVGEPGVGKTAVVEGLARRIVKGRVLTALKGKMIYRVDVGTLADRSSSADDLNAGLQAILKEVRARDDVVLFLDGPRILTTDVWVILKPALSHGGLRVIGALTSGDYDALLGTHPSLERTFVPVQVNEPTVAETVEILKGLRDGYEAHHRVSITDAALVAAATLADRRLPGKRLPGKAVDLIDEAGSLMRIRRIETPPDLREYNERIAQVRKEKESAIDSQDWEKAAALRDNEKRLLAKKATRQKEWEAGDMDVVAEVDEELIAETLAIMCGDSPARPGDAGPPSGFEPRRFPPAAMTDADRQIWGMA